MSIKVEEQAELCLLCEENKIETTCLDCSISYNRLCSICDYQMHSTSQRLQTHQRIKVNHQYQVQPSGIFCICRGVDDGIRPMISCNACPDYYHLECIGLELNQAKILWTYKCHTCIMNLRLSPQVKLARLIGFMDPLETTELPLWRYFPSDVVWSIMCFFSASDLTRSFQVCKGWYACHDNIGVWKIICEQRWTKPAMLELFRLFNNNSTHVDLTNVNWKALYRNLQMGLSQTILQKELDQLQHENARLQERLTQKHSLNLLKRKKLNT